MYPSDDGPIRVSLLIARSRGARRRLDGAVARSVVLRARLAATIETVPAASGFRPRSHDLRVGVR